MPCFLARPAPSAWQARGSRLRRPLVGLLALLALAASPAVLAQPEPAPTALAREVNLATAAATAVISELQPRINGGSVAPADLAPEALRAGFSRAYDRLAGAEAAAGVAPMRETVAAAMLDVVAEFRADILRGGQDAFVPAFFRAQLLGRVNARSPGVRAVASMRDAELINRDSAIARLIDDREILAHVSRLLDSGHREPDMRSVGGRVVGYWPMVIAEACASCHQRNGLVQQVGAFGGATIVIVGR